MRPVQDKNVEYRQTEAKDDVFFKQTVTNCNCFISIVQHDRCINHMQEKTMFRD